MAVNSSHLYAPNFDAYASTYDAFTPIQARVAEELARHIAAYRETNQDKHPERWLDVGCGTGKLIEAVLAHVGQHLPDHIIQLYGVDNAPAMLKQWQMRCTAWLKTANLSADSCQSLCHDMAAMPFADGEMTLTFSSFALHWANPQVLAELVRVTADGGQIHVAVPVLGSLGEVRQRFAKLPIFAFLPVEDWQTVWNDQVQARGGRLLYAHTATFCQTHDNLAQLLIHLKHMGGAVQTGQHLPVGTLRQYLADTSPVTLDYRVWLTGAQF